MIWQANRPRYFLQTTSTIFYFSPNTLGIRIATVTTIGLVTVTALIGQGGLGALMLDGLQRDFRTPLTVGIVLSLTLAVVADLLLVLALRLATPWRRAGRRTRRTAGA